MKLKKTHWGCMVTTTSSNKNNKNVKTACKNREKNVE
jgi:hypothetical protein